ncbi:RcnB family protein [Phenylobacterium sp.]|jgi:Ni/Co efflux regulator RcnB|uniref:RcnB family protein n=1 Tax=Phenylobacterium sp. TaxID=1871053 RepID=UPI002F3E5358
MKTMLIGAIALSLLGGAAANAAPYGYDNRHDAQYDHSDKHQNWRQGQRLPPEYRTRAHYVDYRRARLHAPPRGYQWVRVDNNYAMVALTSGLIASMVASR